MNPHDSQNAIIGGDGGIDLPQKPLDKEILIEEKKMARYSKTAEFKRIQQHCKERIKFYQEKLPNGLEVGLDVVPSTEDWRVANRIIGELKLLMNMYEVARTVVEEAEKDE